MFIARHLYAGAVLFADVHVLAELGDKASSGMAGCNQRILSPIYIAVI